MDASSVPAIVRIAAWRSHSNTSRTSAREKSASRPCRRSATHSASSADASSRCAAPRPATQLSRTDTSISRQSSMSLGSRHARHSLRAASEDVLSSPTRLTRGEVAAVPFSTRHSTPTTASGETPLSAIMALMVPAGPAADCSSVATSAASPSACSVPARAATPWGKAPKGAAPSDTPGAISTRASRRSPSASLGGTCSITSHPAPSSSLCTASRRIWSMACLAFRLRASVQCGSPRPSDLVSQCSCHASTAASTSR
mmetsp:Transcript_5188/g.18984  ORF Transcript_5188/g.18984 Transcript_5188/m.18984 type:complete len:257 (+) Transcript_5188:290-1060(+)